MPPPPPSSGGPSPPSSSSPTSQPDAPATQPPGPTPAEPKKRVRRWHHRGFTGCSTCRRRHVRCDEASPSCRNCTRLGLECDGTQGRMTFKVYGPQGSQETTTTTTNNNAPSTASSSKAPKKRGKKAETAGASTVVKKEPTDEEAAGKIGEIESVDAVVVSPTTVAESAPARYQMHDPFRLVMANPLDVRDARYYTHFIDQVASLLLIYDNPININPYRRYFPELARESPSMASAMQALGALHLANTSRGQQRIAHFQQAMGSYGEVVKTFRTRYTQPTHQLGLTDFATCLLLSLFEVSFFFSGLTFCPIGHLLPPSFELFVY